VNTDHKNIVELISESQSPFDSSSNKMVWANKQQKNVIPGATGDNQLSYNLNYSSSDDMNNSDDSDIREDDLFVPQEEISHKKIEKNLMKAIK